MRDQRDVTPEAATERSRRKLHEKYGYPTLAAGVWQSFFLSATEWPTSVAQAARQIVWLSAFDPVRGTDEQLEQIKAHVAPPEGEEFIKAVTRLDLATALADHHGKVAGILGAPRNGWDAVEAADRHARRAHRYRLIAEKKVLTTPVRRVFGKRASSCSPPRGARRSTRSARRGRTQLVRNRSRARAPASPGDDDPHPERVARLRALGGAR